jgi:hypothetical protein
VHGFLIRIQIVLLAIVELLLVLTLCIEVWVLTIRTEMSVEMTCVHRGTGSGRW